MNDLVQWNEVINYLFKIFHWTMILPQQPTTINQMKEKRNMKNHDHKKLLQKKTYEMKKVKKQIKAIRTRVNTIRYRS